MREMALRRFGDGSLDDVVVKDVSMFRAEFMSETELWLCCYFDQATHDRITFCVFLDGDDMKLQETEMPKDWRDIDIRPYNWADSAFLRTALCGDGDG